jgi:hypothetical protein
MSKLLFALSCLLERAPLARYHGLHALGSDLYYVAKYGRGRYPAGRWTYKGLWYYGPDVLRRAIERRCPSPGE